MSRHVLTYNGVNLIRYGVYVSGEDSWGKPAPNITRIAVPGRSGDLAVFNNRFENVEIPYHLGIVEDFSTNYNALISFLLSDIGYKKLVDSYHPDVYRMALIETGISPQMTRESREGTFDLVFNCKPQIYLDSGDTAVTFTSSGYVENPTQFRAKPLLRVYGTGRLTVSGTTIEISENSNYTDIDCELEDAYRGTENRNRYVTLSSGEFPTISPGRAGITMGSGITKVIVTPRWWRL